MANPQVEDGYTQIANEILEHLVKLHLAPNQWQVLLCVIRKTYGYHKKVDYIANSQIVTATGLCKAVVSRTLHNLNDMNLIERKGKNINFQKDWERWQKLAIQSTNEKSAVQSAIDIPISPKVAQKMRIVRTDGYIGIWQGVVEPEFQSMATKQGYILEHRLVMARKLGRPLELWEIVHHKDSIRSHNTDDNLELLPSQNEHMPSILAQQRIKQLEEELAVLQTKVDGKKLAISSPTLAISSTKVSSPAVTQKKKETIQKKIAGLKNPALGLENEEVKRVFEGLKESRGYDSSKPGAEAKAIRWMLKRGYKAEDILGCYDHLKVEPFWVNKPLQMMTVQSHIGEYKHPKETSWAEHMRG